MHRWNGWGDPEITLPLPPSAKEYLTRILGPLVAYPDAELNQVLTSVPESTLPPHPLVITDPLKRLLHARGQSLPDWIVLRSGTLSRFPDGVAYPISTEEVSQLIDYAQNTDTVLIPYGGGTSVVGHINPPPDQRPVLTVDLRRMNQLVDLDETSLLATFGAGVKGPSLERQLNANGFTLGHYPQSWERSTLGGWIATRSSGQQSVYYGRIEDLFAGGHLETPLGPLELPPYPASAAGPDLRQLVLGSEGRLGVVTLAKVRIRPLPETEKFFGVFFPHWESAVNVVRSIVQEKIPVSMLRLSDPRETETSLMLTGRERLVSWAVRALSTLGYGAERCLLIVGVTGRQKVIRRTLHRVRAAVRAHGGLSVGGYIGEQWRRSRFLTPYLRNTLWEQGIALDTLETAVPWSQVTPTKEAVVGAITDAIATFDEQALVFAHLSHAYPDGASIYVTYLFRRTEDPEVLISRWQKMKTAASQTIIDHGGTISHQHGVGRDHAPLIEAEKGQMGVKMLASVCRTVDPAGILNPGVLLPEE